MKYTFVIISFIIMVFSRCYYDSEENLYPELNQDCDTINISFTKTIKPLLSANCLACHSNSTANGFGNNITLENYSDVVTLQASVLGSIQHAPAYSPMPKNGGKLNSCAIQQFELWIKSGSPEN